MWAVLCSSAHHTDHALQVTSHKRERERERDREREGGERRGEREKRDPSLSAHCDDVFLPRFFHAEFYSFFAANVGPFCVPTCWFLLCLPTERPWRPYTRKVAFFSSSNTLMTRLCSMLVGTNIAPTCKPEFGDQSKALIKTKSHALEFLVFYARGYVVRSELCKPEFVYTHSVSHDFFLTHVPCVAYRHRAHAWLEVFAVRCHISSSHPLHSHVSSAFLAVPARSLRDHILVCTVFHPLHRL